MAWGTLLIISQLASRCSCVPPRPTPAECDADLSRCRRRYHRGQPVPTKEVRECQIEIGYFVEPEVVKLLHDKDEAHLLTKEGGGQKEQRLWMCSVLKRDIFDKGVPGAVVELGVYKGATSTLIAHTIARFRGR